MSTILSKSSAKVFNNFKIRNYFYIFTESLIMKTSYLTNFVIFISLPIVISSCSPLFRIKNKVKNTKCVSYYCDAKSIIDYDRPNVPGLRKSFQENDYIDIYLVHGVQTKKIDSYDTFMYDIANRLGLHEFHKEDFKNKLGKSNPQIRLLIFKKKNEEKFLRFIYINWSPVSESYKQLIKGNYLKYVNSDKIKKAKFIEKNLKQKLMQDGVTDIMAMIDIDNRRRLYVAFETAILLSEINPIKLKGSTNISFNYSDFDNRSVKKVVISGSFGSKLVQDCFDSYYEQIICNNGLISKKEDRLLQSTERVINFKLEEDSDSEQIEFYKSKLKGRDYDWYLMSNQLTLLDGVDYGLPFDSLNCNYPLTDTENSIENNLTQQFSVTRDDIILKLFDRNDSNGKLLPSKRSTFTDKKIYEELVAALKYDPLYLKEQVFREIVDEILENGIPNDLDSFGWRIHDQMEELVKQVRDSTATFTSRINMISFFDPNDILGFYVPKYDHYGDRYAYRIWNIVSPSTNIEIASMANPGDAHSDCWYNKAILAIICEGWDLNNKSLRKAVKAESNRLVRIQSEEDLKFDLIH